MSGYDLGTLRAVASAVDIPVVACGGARNLGDCRAAIREAGAAAVAAGSMFVFQGVHRAVLISFPTRREIEQAFC
jgi:cyclase